MDQEQNSDLRWISVARNDLINAIKRLSPGRMTAARKKSELQIGLENDEMVLCLPGSMTKCPASGNWPGLLRTQYIFLHSLIKVPPVVNPVILKFADDRLKIDRLSVTASWHYAGVLTSSIAIGAHLDSEIQPTETLYCPRCGKHQGIDLSKFTLPSKPTAQEWILSRLAERQEASHGCKACGHGWRELG